MPEAVEWDAGGTPRSPRFGDVYRTASGGLEQARHVFLQGCGLPEAWQGRRQWRILETGFGLGLNFLAAWRCWKDDPRRCGMLHFVSVEAFPVSPEDLLRSAAPYPELHPLAEELAAQWWGLVPGLHRLVFEQGRVLLTLCVGDVKDMLKEQAFAADSVFLDGFDPRLNPQMWELGTLKSVARLCRRGAGIATWTAAGDVRRDLLQCGFQVERAAGLPPKRHCLQGRYDPAWEPKGLPADAQREPARCMVIGAGLAGAAVAASLARRGWSVEVLDAAQAPASGASGLPAGMLAPHQSPDDNPLSRLSRAGVRATFTQLHALLHHGQDWEATGVLENRMDDTRPLPALQPALDVWTRDASDAQKQQAGLSVDANAWWHERAAWVKPAALVGAWLAQPGVTWRGNTHVARLEHVDGLWCAMAQDGASLAQAELVVVAAALGSAGLVDGAITVRPVRGQVSWDEVHEADLPPFPVNGNGHFIPRVPLGNTTAWFSGATYGRGEVSTEPRPEDHEANLERLQGLVPAIAPALAPAFQDGSVRAWTGVRCASTDRRPLVGELAPGLCVSTALGSRGLTFAVLCAELLAAQLHAEPWPVERRLGESLAAARQRG